MFSPALSLLIQRQIERLSVLSRAAYIALLNFWSVKRHECVNCETPSSAPEKECAMHKERQFCSNANLDDATQQRTHRKLLADLKRAQSDYAQARHRASNGY